MERIPIEVAMRDYQGVYTDRDPDNLPPNYLSYALNTKWINANTIGKRAGLETKEWAGTGYHRTASFPTGLVKPEVLYYQSCQKRGGDNIYDIVLLREQQPTPSTAATGYLYIEITNAETGVLVADELYDYATGGATRNQLPTQGKIIQWQDYVLIADSSTDKFFYIDISTETNVTIATQAVAAASGSHAITDIDIHVNRAWASGDKGKVYYSALLNPLSWATGNYIEYRATQGAIAKEIVSTYAGLLVCSENTDLNHFTSDLMEGTVPFDISQAATQSRGFQVKGLSNDTSFISGSMQNIDNTIIGLTQAGLVDLQTLIASATEITGGTVGSAVGVNLKEEDTLSYPLADIFRSMNKSSTAIYSCHDPIAKRYYLSVPSEDEVSATSFVYAYDYKYKKGVPRWSIWRYAIPAVKGMFTARNRPYIADSRGYLYLMDTGTLDGTYDDEDDPLGRYFATIESAGVGGESDYYVKNWNGVSVRLKSLPNSDEKHFRIYGVSDEYIGTKNNNNKPIYQAVLMCLQKFSNFFDRFYIFGRDRTFDDEGLGRELYFKKIDLFQGRNLRVVIEEDSEADTYLTYWELKNIYIKGQIIAEASE